MYDLGYLLLTHYWLLLTEWVFYIINVPTNPGCGCGLSARKQDVASCFHTGCSFLLPYRMQLPVSKQDVTSCFHTGVLLLSRMWREAKRIIFSYSNLIIFSYSNFKTSILNWLNEIYIYAILRPTPNANIFDYSLSAKYYKYEFYHNLNTGANSTSYCVRFSSVIPLSCS